MFSTLSMILNRCTLTIKMIILVSVGAAGLFTLAVLGSFTAISLADLARDAIERRNECVEVANCATAISATVQRGILTLTVTSALFALLLAPLFGLVTITIVSRAKHAEQAARSIANRDLSRPLRVVGNDEIGQLLASLSQMQLSLMDVVGQISGSAESVATSSNEISGGVQDLSSRTEQQASALQETTATLRAVTETVRSNAKSARSASDLAQEANSLASSGGQVVIDVVTTMLDIQASSKRMSEVLAVIDGIAFQTNILALNAAVESARAGAQGRGFAVVASEVRALAQRSAESAREIKTLINGSIEQVEKGSKLVEQSGQTMQSVIHAVSNVTQLVGEISQASAGQSVSLEQVSQAVAALDQMTQQNSALVEQSAAASESLSERGAELKRLVSQFQLA